MGEPFYPPENYYRVSVKALVFDTQGRLLVFQDKAGEWEIPGGGWDHGEDYEACIRRELAEEVGAKVDAIGPFAFFYRCDTHKRKHPKISLAFYVQLVSITDFTPQADDLVDTRFVTKEEFLQLQFQPGEHFVQNYADQIWRPVEKTD